MKLPREVLADLARSGLTRADAEKMQIAFLPAGDKRLTAHYPKLDADAYAIPFFEPSGEESDFARFKLLGHYQPKGEKEPRKYLQIPGTKPRIYFPPFINGSLADPAHELFIVEGEKKAAALAKHGIAAIGLTGVECFTSDSGNPIADLQLIKWAGRRVHIAFDSDAAFNPNVQRARKRLTDELIRRGANPFAVELPTLDGETKTGVDDFLVAHGNGKKAVTAFRALPRIPLFVPDGFDFTQLMQMTIPELEYIVPSLLPVGVTLFVGPPKIGKSAAIYDWLISLTCGEPILREFATKPTTVAYLALEDTPRRLKVRGEKLLAARKLERKLDPPQTSASAPKRLLIRHEWPRDPQTAVAAVDRLLHDNPDVRVLVIDTLAKVREAPTANSNAYAVDYAAVSVLKRIADKHRVAIVVIHHTRKAEDADDVLNEINGSNGLAGAADGILILKRKRSQSDGSLYITGRDAEERTLALRFQFPRWSSLGDAQQHRTSVERLEVLQLLADEPGGLGRADLAKLLSKKPRTVRYLLDCLRDDGLVQVDEKHKYTLTSTGGLTLKGEKQ